MDINALGVIKQKLSQNHLKDSYLTNYHISLCCSSWMITAFLKVTKHLLIPQLSNQFSQSDSQTLFLQTTPSLAESLSYHQPHLCLFSWELPQLLNVLGVVLDPTVLNPDIHLNDEDLGEQVMPLTAHLIIPLLHVNSLFFFNMAKCLVVLFSAFGSCSFLMHCHLRQPSFQSLQYHLPLHTSILTLQQVELHSLFDGIYATPCNIAGL